VILISLLIKMDRVGLRILGFLKAKGLLIVPKAPPQPNVKLNVEEVLQFASEHEPRVLEVLPAAIIHFPRTFLHQENLPTELKTIIDSIRKGEKKGPDFRGIRYKNMLRWAQKELSDKRTVPLSEKRVMKSFRFKPTTLLQLKQLAEKSQSSETQIVEKLLEHYGLSN